LENFGISQGFILLVGDELRLEREGLLLEHFFATAEADKSG